MAKHLSIHNLLPSFAVLLWPTLAMADRYGIQEAMEYGGAPSAGGAGMKAVLGGIAAGALIGYAYSLYHNIKHAQKVAADGCIIIGGMLGMFVLPFIFILLSK